MSFFHSLLTQSQSAVTYSAEAEAVFANFSGGNALTTAEKNAIARFVDRQVLAGNWAKIRTFVFAHLSSEAKSQLDWKGVRNALPTGSPTWSQAVGWTTNGSSSYIDSQFVPSTDGGGIFLLNDSQVGAYVHSGSNGTIWGAIGSTSTNQIFFTSNGAGGTYLMRMHEGSGITSGAGTGSTGTNRLFASYRTASNAQGYYRDEAFIQSGTQASTALGNRAVCFGARRNNTTVEQFNAIVLGSYWFGAGVGFDWTAWNVGLRNMLYEFGVYGLTQPIFVSGAAVPKYQPGTNDVLVYLFAGQSNQGMQNAGGSNLPYSFLNTTLNAKVYYNPTLASDGDWYDIISGTNANHYDLTKGGVVERFGYSMDKIVPGKIRIINFAKGATGLYVEGGGVEDWNVASSNDLYHKFTTNYILPALADIVAEGKTPRIMGIDWDQGEHEASGGATTYEDDLVDFLTGVVNTMYNAGYDVSKCRITIKRIHNLTNGLWSYRDDVRAIHEDVGTNLLTLEPTMSGRITGIKYYSTDDFEYSDSPPVHYTKYSTDRKAYLLVNYHSEFVKP